MKKFLYPFLAFLVLVQTMHQSIIYWGYELNQEVITEKYCENKTKPKRNCLGKCHLKKELSKDEKQNSDKAQTIKIQFDIFTGKVSSEIEWGFYAIVSSNKFFQKLSMPFSGYTNAVFQPPCLLS